VKDGHSVGFTNSSGRLSQNQLLAEREKNFTLTSDVALFKMDSKFPAALWIPWKTTTKKNADNAAAEEQVPKHQRDPIRGKP
jgi:hypothetical protein